ncbi:MAG: ATP-binding cassette protein [Anaeromyxobacteraceae bacterium]|jgi:branched-chain amino acid transport system ATP-binding protein|nr:ATP-binding cassette protein [Anaeromyxobacteraceae bacterium]
MLRIESLDVSIKSVRILRGVGLQLDRGQLIGLIGRNGAGKTTLMRAIMGILTPTAGTITFDGAPMQGVPSFLRARGGIGYMPEDRRIIPQLSIEENVSLPAWAAGQAHPDERLRRIYEMIPEVGQLRERKGLQLSGGQQKLAALARALMSGTKLLLLDEPFEGVAPVLARRLAEVVAMLRTEGLSVILSESDLSHSRKLIDVVYNIDRGQVTRAAA